MGKWSSCGFEFDTKPEKFGELRSSNDILEDGQALRRRMEEDGYLLLREVLDRDAVIEARRELVGKLDSIGDIDRNYPLIDAIFNSESENKPMSATGFARTLGAGEAIRYLVHQGEMIEFYRKFFGKEVRPLDFVWVRTTRVGSSAGCHYDWVYMGRGSELLHTSWTPIGDVSKMEGALAILEGSHKFDELISTYGSIDVDDERTTRKYKGQYTPNPVEVQKQFGGKWLTTDFEVGDLLLFTMHTMHCSLDNKSPENRIRLSVDTRYQPADEPVDERWVGQNPVAHGDQAKRN